MSLLRRLIGSRRPPSPEPERFTGSFDEIRDGDALGWAADRQEPDRLVTVSLRIDGRIVAQGLADRLRADVQAAGFGRGLGGFSLRIPEAFADGAEHRVDVLAGSSEAPLPNGPRLYRADALGPAVLGAGGTRILGRFEGLLNGAAIGWAYDPDAPSARLELELVIDDAPAGRIRADTSRLDVAAAGYGDGFHGFAGRLPAWVYDDRPHTVSVTIAGTGIRLPGEPALLQQPRSGVAYLDRPAACIAGWTTQGADVDIRYDGGPPVRVGARRLVPGFGNESTAMASCGFRSPVPPACLDGVWHAASVRFADSDEELSGSPFEFRLRTPPVRLGLTRSSGRLVEGWVTDALAPDEPVRLAVLADGVALGEVVADRVRADAPGRPAQGFAFSLPRAAHRLDFALARTPATPFASFSVGRGETRPLETDGIARQDEARFIDPALAAMIRSAFAAFLEAPGTRFDVAWYRAAYPDALRAADGDADAAALDHYRERGHAEGRSPSPLFDEAWYRRWPSVGRAVAAGLIPCGFAHYLAVGARAGFDPVPGLDALAADPALAEAVRSGAAHAPLAAAPQRAPSGMPTAQPAAPEPSPEPSDPSRGLYGDWIARLLRQAEAGTAAAIAASDRAIRARLAAPLPETPLVSVIMPTSNRAHTIAEAIGSVLEQSYPNWELLVCDDGSTDRTAQVVAQMADPRIRTLALEKANGAVARNRGLAMARGAYIAYLDSDNLWHPSFLDVMLRALLAAPSRPCAYAGYVDTEIVGTRVELQALAVTPFDPVRLAAANFIDLNTICHHRHLYDWLGGFDETLPRVQDWDLALRYFSIFRPLHVPELLAFYRRNVAWGQVTAAASVEDTNAIVTRKTAARLADGHLQLDIDWPADPRLTLILGPGPEAALLAALLIHPVAHGAEVTLAHAGRAPEPRPLHPADPVADLPLGPDAFASAEALAAALAPFLPREGAVLALGLPDAVIADLSRRLGRPVDGLVLDADGLGITGPDLARPFHLGTLPLSVEPPAPPDRPALLRLGGADDSLPATDDAILAPADLASGPWRRIGPAGPEPWPERGPAALARALAEADALASLAPVEEIGVLGLCLVTEAMRRGLPVTLAPSPFADPLIAAGAVAGLGAAPSAAPHPSAAGGGRTHGLAFHAELIAERLRFYLYRRCFEGDR